MTNIYDSISDNYEEYEKIFDDHAKYKNGNVCFKISDIKNIFGPNVMEIDFDLSLYRKNIDYVFIKKELYLTYIGILRVLFASQSRKVDKFVGWATKTLFIVQMGPSDNKLKLASKLLGIYALTIKEVFNTSSTNVPCIYLFTLGTVKDLRKSMKLNNEYKDDMIICKFGLTDSLERRAGEHNKTYGSIKGANLCLRYYAHIDVQYMSKAEKDIREYFEAMECKLEYDKHKELIIIDPPRMNKYVKQQYSNLSNLYAGHIKDLIKKIEELDNKLLIQVEKNKNELQEEKHKNEILMEQHRIQEEVHKNELLTERQKQQEEKYKSDMLIEQYKNQLEVERQKHEIEILKKELEISKMSKNNKK